MNNNLSNNLKKIRKDNNLSQEQLADDLGVSRQAISKWESGTAYPEMDKIIQICKNFDVNINDLLNNDIKEIKSEQESKSSINNYIDDFLNFITKTINMFTSFDKKTKVKCIFEQIFVFVTLCIAFTILDKVCNDIVVNIINILPDSAYIPIHNLFESTFYILFIVAGVIIFLHIFKTRYLDYYEFTKDDNKEINNKENIEQVVNNIESKNISNEKIVIRDPKHSEYKFLKGLLKLIILGIKAFSLFITLGFSFTLVMLVIGLVMSFLISKTGLCFIGLLVSLIGAIIINIIVILLLVNFVFSRKNNKKVMIWSFIFSLIAIGIGSGLIFMGSLNFSIVDSSNSDLLKSGIIEIDMKDNLRIEDFTTDHLEYIESNIDNVKIEYSIIKYYDASYGISTSHYTNDFYIYGNCKNGLQIIREVIKHLNKKEIFDINNEIVELKIYASKANIAKIQNNNRR